MSEPEKLKNNSDLQHPVDNSLVPVDKPKKNGGARPGAGRKKGKMNRRSIEKMHVKKKFEDIVAAKAMNLFHAQYTVAVGSIIVLKRTKIRSAKGWRWSKWEAVVDQQEIVDYVNDDYEKSETTYYQITAEKPDIMAINQLLDRAFGKAPQSLNIKDDRPDPIAAILTKFGLLEDGGDSKDAGQTEGSESSTPTIVP